MYMQTPLRNSSCILVGLKLVDPPKDSDKRSPMIKKPLLLPDSLGGSPEKGKAAEDLYAQQASLRKFKDEVWFGWGSAVQMFSELLVSLFKFVLGFINVC